MASLPPNDISTPPKVNELLINLPFDIPLFLTWSVSDDISIVLLSTLTEKFVSVNDNPLPAVYVVSELLTVISEEPSYDRLPEKSTLFPGSSLLITLPELPVILPEIVFINVFVPLIVWLTLVVITALESDKASLKDIVSVLLLEFPINILLWLREGQALVLPAPPTRIVHLSFFIRIIIPIFCMRLLSLLGGIFVNLPFSLALI